MKKSLLLIALMVGCMSASAQKIEKNELRQLQAFLSQPAEKAATNAEALKITDLKNPASWEGVTVSNGHVTAIEWSDKHLAGELNLAGFDALTKLNVSRNALTSLNVEGDAAITRIDAQRNKLTNVSLSGNTSLQTLNIYKNRLTEFSLTGTPIVETVNISNNYLVGLDVANSTSLKTLNCQGNHLEMLKVEYCTALKNL